MARNGGKAEEHIIQYSILKNWKKKSISMKSSGIDVRSISKVLKGPNHEIFVAEVFCTIQSIRVWVVD